MSERSAGRARPVAGGGSPAGTAPSVTSAVRPAVAPSDLAHAVLAAPLIVVALVGAPSTAFADELPPTVFADGTGLPSGRATAAEGAPLYAARCAGCHGAAGEGASAVELVGDPALIDGPYPDRGIAVHWPYAPPLFDYVRRSMPPDAPWSLSATETYAVIARVLELNGLVDAGTPVDAGFLANLPMPNVNGFESAPD